MCIYLLHKTFNQSFFSYGKVNGKSMLRVFRLYLRFFFSGKSFMQYALGALQGEK